MGAAHVSALRSELPRFLEHFLEHLKGEEENLNPVGRKYVPLALQKELTRKVWELTDATRGEVIIPYIVNNHVDAVMWERLRVDVPEMVPRGAFNWCRYY